MVKESNTLFIEKMNGVFLCEADFSLNKKCWITDLPVPKRLVFCFCGAIPPTCGQA
jgi:hypothetical protein